MGRHRRDSLSHFIFNHSWHDGTKLLCEEGNDMGKVVR
jgi:hypothetical protein